MTGRLILTWNNPDGYNVRHASDQNSKVTYGSGTVLDARSRIDAVICVPRGTIVIHDERHKPS